MLTERHLENYADVLWWGLSTARRQRFRKNDVVQIRFHAAAVRLMEILYRKLLEKGLNPVPRLSPTPDMEHSFYRISGNRQLVFMPPGKERFVDNLSGSIFLNAPESLTHLRAADPRKIGRASRGPPALPRRSRTTRGAGRLQLDALLAADRGACAPGRP